MTRLFTAVERRGAPAQGRRWLSVGLAALALTALVAVVASREDTASSLRTEGLSIPGTHDGMQHAAAAELQRPSLNQMLEESVRLQKEGRAFPTFDLPSSTSDRVRDLGQRATSGKHALDWRKGSGDAQTRDNAVKQQQAYEPPAGDIDRVDDPVGDEAGWVVMGDRAFRVTRGEDGSLDHLDIPGDARVRPVSDGWEVDIPDAGERDRYNDRYMMQRAPRRLTREHFSDEAWAANKLGRKFYQAEVDKNSRRDPEWLDTPKEMDRAGWNEDNSMMPVRASRDSYDAWSMSHPDATGTRDRYYHWVTQDGRTDADGVLAEESKTDEGKAEPVSDKMIPQVQTGDDSKPTWLVVRQSVPDGTVKVERDVHGGIKHVAVPLSAMVEANGASGWKISFPVDAARLNNKPPNHVVSSVEGTVRVADAQDPLNKEKFASMTPQWAKVSAPGDLPGEDAKVSSVVSDEDPDTDEINGQAVDRAAYGIPERSRPPVMPASVRGGEAAPRNSRDALASPRQVWGGWEPSPDRKPIVDVYAPNEDPFYCMDGTESSICGTTGRPEQEHDYSLGWGSVAKAQRALAREKSKDGAGELGDRPARQRTRSGYRETPASGDPYKYVRDGNYAKILKHEDDVVAGGRSTGRVEMSSGEQGEDREDMEKEVQVEHNLESMKVTSSGDKFATPQEKEEQQTSANTAIRVPPLPYKVRAPYDGSLNRIGYPNMRGGMRAEDGELLPYDDRSGAGNNAHSHKDWASDVWARPSPFGTREVRDSLNRNEEGGARRLVDERGFHEYEAGNQGFHEPLPHDEHDADYSRESQGMRVDQFDIVGDQEGRRRAARGGDGNADEYESSRPASKADWDRDVEVQPMSQDKDGDTKHIYMSYSDKAAYGESDLSVHKKEEASLRIAEMARRRAEELESHVDRRSDESTRGGTRSSDKDEDSMGWDRRNDARDGEGYKEERREHEYEERFNRMREDEKRFRRAREERQHERQQLLLQRWSRRAARDAAPASSASSHTELGADGHLEQLAQSLIVSPSAQAAENRVNEIAAAKLAAHASLRTSHLRSSLSAKLAEEHVNEAAARKLAAQARLSQRHASLRSTSASGVEAQEAGDTISKIGHQISSWLGSYEHHKPLPARTSLSAGVDAVDDYNKKALDHILGSAHGGDASARLATRQAYDALKKIEHPAQLQLQRSLQKSSTLAASLGDYLDDYGSGPQDAAAADGINL